MTCDAATPANTRTTTPKTAPTTNRPLKIALGIAFTILVVELIGVIITGSLALFIDTAHMAADAAGLLIALTAANLTQRKPTNRRTWGFARAEVLAATLQAALLLGIGLFVIIESIQRLLQPTLIPSGPLLAFGIIGLLGNIAAVSVLAKSRNTNFNLKAAFLEVLNDALGSLAVIIAAITITLTGYTNADTVAAILIGTLIIPRTIKLLKATINVLLESTPPGLDLQTIRDHMLQLEHVQEVHDLHITQVATGLPVLTAHVTLDTQCFTDGHAPDILDQLQQCVLQHFPISIEHSTFQLEPAHHQTHETTPHH